MHKKNPREPSMATTSPPLTPGPREEMKPNTDKTIVQRNHVTSGANQTECRSKGIFNKKSKVWSLPWLPADEDVFLR